MNLKKQTKKQRLIWPCILSWEYAKSKLHRERTARVKQGTRYMPETWRNVFLKRVKTNSERGVQSYLASFPPEKPLLFYRNSSKGRRLWARRNVY